MGDGSRRDQCLCRYYESRDLESFNDRISGKEEILNLPILYQDEYLVAVAKPPGIHVHHTELSPKEPSVLQRLRNQLGKYLYPVHRLDRGTSGVMIFALDRSVASTLGQAFQDHGVEKSYLALVRGFYPRQLDIDIALKDEKQGLRKPSRTLTALVQRYEIPLPIGKFEKNRVSLVQVSPLSGRRHQIRQHLAKVNHPVIGDTTYGDRHQNSFFREHFHLTHLQLFSVEIRFRHPVTGEILEIIDNNSSQEILKSLEPYIQVELEPGNP